MKIVAGTADDISSALFSKMAQYRHQVFVETLKWKLDTAQGMELDQFDNADTIYIISQDDEGDVNGVARLLPTSRPYLLRDVFPQLLNGLPPPCHPDIWELSRFSTTDFQNRSLSGPNQTRQVSSPIAVQMLRSSISCAIALGATRLITVSPLGVERLMRRAGFHAHRAGPPMIVGGHPLFACWIELADNATQQTAPIVSPTRFQSAGSRVDSAA